MDQSQERQQRIMDLREIARVVFTTPRLWFMAVAVAVVLSTFEVVAAADGRVTIRFHIGLTTALLLSLSWLPALLRIFGIIGVTLKTPYGEATSRGLFDWLRDLDPQTKQEILPALAASLKPHPAASTADQARVESLRQAVEDELAALPIEAEEARAQLKAIAGQYEEIRQTPYSAARTFQLETLLANVRALAKRADFTPAELDERCGHFESAPEGQRIVTLGLLEALPGTVRCLDSVLQAIKDPRTPFEQYHALRAALALWPKFDAAQQSQLVDLLTELRAAGRIRPGSDRWLLSDQLLARSGARARVGLRDAGML